MWIKTPIKISEHARIAMQNRRVSKDEILGILAEPTVVYTNQRKESCFIKGNLCVVVKQLRYFAEVKTVLFAVQEQWTDEDVRKRLLDI